MWSDEVRGVLVICFARAHCRNRIIAAIILPGSLLLAIYLCLIWELCSNKQCKRQRTGNHRIRNKHRVWDGQLLARLLPCLLGTLWWIAVLIWLYESCGRYGIEPLGIPYKLILRTPSNFGHLILYEEYLKYFTRNLSTCVLKINLIETHINNVSS